MIKTEKKHSEKSFGEKIKNHLIINCNLTSNPQIYKQKNIFIEN
jgi:hypothetical protein